MTLGKTIILVLKCNFFQNAIRLELQMKLCILFETRDTAVCHDG